MGDSRGQSAATEVEVWLRSGGRVVAASERAARAVTHNYNLSRRAEGLEAWPAPVIQSWNQFLQDVWASVAADEDRLVLNPAQEEALWIQIISESPQGKYLLPGPLERIAKMAVAAHGLLCAYSPAMLKDAARSNWQQDHAAFSNWIADFDKRCASGRLLSTARLPLEIIPLLEMRVEKRTEILLVGFDRLQPVQSKLLQSWGGWRQVETGEFAEQKVFYATPDQRSELNAVARWCRKKLDLDRDARLMVVTQDLPKRRGEFERAFSQELSDGNLEAQVEFSLGVPLAELPIIRSGLLLLKWLCLDLAENELDWLLGCGFAVNGSAETFALTGFMRAVRRNGLQRTHWRCNEFLDLRTAAELPAVWTARIGHAMRTINESGAAAQTPLYWADLIPRLLQQAGWPGERTLSSEEFQALRRWQHGLETCASLGFDGRRFKWIEFLQVFDQRMAETLFAPESQDASVLITGPAESAGLEADAIWFMGASEEAWPRTSSLHPLLPVGLQRDFGMPHATAQQDWNLARSVTQRLFGSAQEIVFSYSRQIDGVEMRPSRLVENHVGQAQHPKESDLTEDCGCRTEAVEDVGCVPFLGKALAGGAAVLSAQSQCPFKAFASARLRAEDWEPAQAGLTAPQRGELLHEVLHSVWGEQGIRSLAELKQIADLDSFTRKHVYAALARVLPARVLTRMPKAYLALEEERLVRLVSEWLNFESTRAEFVVSETEIEKQVILAGLSLRLRLDRIDRLNDGKFLVIDYKTGDVSTRAWQIPRPEDVQLPLYAGFALGEENELGGLVFAKVRSGDYEFAGFVENAVATLIPNGIERKSLAKNALSPEQMSTWREYIEKLANDFLAGCADVDPIDAHTCLRCNLQTLCRIEETSADDEAGEVVDNE